MEIWKDISGYGGDYQVSNLGRVKSLRYKTPRILGFILDTRGYCRVRLFSDSGRRAWFVHQLVARAFIPNPFNKPQVNHINGIKTDNCAENLEWCTAAENTLHAFGLKLRGTDEDAPRSKFTNEEARYIRDNPDDLTQTQLAEMFNVGVAAINNIQLGRTYRNAGGTVRKSNRVSKEKRAEIRRKYVFGSAEFGSYALAKEYNVSHGTILNIVKGGDDK